MTPPGERKLRLPVLDTQAYQKTRKWHSAIRKIQGHVRWDNRGSARSNKLRAIADEGFRTQVRVLGSSNILGISGQVDTLGFDPSEKGAVPLSPATTQNGDDSMSALVDQYSKQELEEIVKSCRTFKGVLARLGYQSSSSAVRKRLVSVCKELNIDTSHFSHQIEVPKRTPENTFIENSSASQNTLRKMYKEGNYTEYKCAICGQEPIWNGRELVLTLDHINGINNDDRLDNLRWLCPNCDRQTQTFGGKNIKRKERRQDAGYCIYCKKPVSYNATMCKDCLKLHKSTKINFCGTIKPQDKPTKEELLKLITEYKSFTAVGRLYNVSDNAVKKWCKSYGMSSYIADYRPKKEIVIKKEPTQCKPVHMIDIHTNKIIRTFPSLNAAGKQFGSLASMCISRVCNGTRKTAYGYKWQFVNQ